MTTSNDLSIAMTQPKSFVFVLMPFSAGFDDVYELGIKAACDEAGAYCERVDKQIFTENILDRLINQIAKADIVVADMTGKNPNVFYECGYAHALGKTVILLTQDVADIPFDLQQYPHIVYKGRITDLKSELVKRLSFFMAHPKLTRLHGVWSLRLYQNGRSIDEHGQVSAHLTQNGNISIVLDIHNPMSDVFNGQNCSVALESDFLLREARSDERSVILPSGKYMAPLAKLQSIYPLGWLPFRFDLKPFEAKFKLDEVLQLTMRFFTQAGVRELPIVVTIRSEAPKDGRWTLSVEKE